MDISKQNVLAQMDFEKINQDKKITSQLDNNETIVFSLKIIKFSGGN